MENIGEGYISGFDLHLDNDEREILKKALLVYLQFCLNTLELGSQEVLCKNLLRKIGCHFSDDALFVYD